MLLLILLVFLPALVSACPEVVSKLCKCEDLHNGVILDCSNSDGQQVVQVLREHQAQLGLVQALTMQNAQLKQLPASFLAGLYIKKLDVSHNEMKTVHENAFSGMSPVLQELFLNHNNITKIPVGALDTIPTLLRLDLSNNSISDLEESDALPSMPKLFDINLGSNKICGLHTSIFHSVKNTIQTVNLRNNCLKAVPSSAIRGMTQLKSIHMHNNNITSLDALNFLNLPVLNLLNLANNRISELNRRAFLNVPNLRYLYLTDNRIKKLAEHQFVTFEKLEMLDLTGNLIEEIPPLSLSQLPSLRQLYLGNNHIASIGKNAFVNSSVVILSLSGNRLKELPEGIFEGMPALQQISFKSNQIKTVDQNAFYNVPTLAMVDLSDNQIIDLAPSTFLAQLNLLLIDLSSNKIPRTPYAAFNRRIGSVLLKENPLVCTEKVHMLQDGVGMFIPNSEDIICGGTSSTTTTTTAAPQTTPIQITKQKTTEDQKPAGAFQRAGLIHPPNTESELLPARPTGSQRPSVLNIRPRQKTRPQGVVNTDMSRTMDRIPVSAIEEKLPIQSVGGVLEQESEEVPEQLPTREKKPATHSRFISTTTLGPRVYTDIADNPNIIHPFPVPFLKRGPQIHQATRIKASTDAPAVPSKHTLPPSILLAPKTKPITSTDNSVENAVTENETFEQFALKSGADLSDREETTPVIKTSERLASPTTIIIICLSTVAIVMLAVFVSLCIARHRQHGRFTSSYSDSSVARTNAYVQSQAHMNMIYGSVGRDHQRTLHRPDNSQPWLYNPGNNYCNYYK